AVSLSATYLRFADQPLGTTSTPLPVRLTNSGQAPLAITSISTSGNYAQTNNCVSPLAPRAYCTINLTFTPPPTVAGGQSGTLTIVDNAPGSPHTVALGGVGVGPVAVLSTTSLNFGNQPVGTTSVPRLVNLSNTGNAPMTVTGIIVSGDFGQSSNCPSTLAARGYCTMTVTFMPAATGPRNGAITVTDNAAGSPHVVSLTGTGIAPAVSLSATYLRFADQPLGTTSAPLPVRLTNSGQAPLAITSISTSGNYAQTNNCVSPLAPRAYCTINLTFTPPPTVAGGQGGTLTTVDNAPGSPHTVALGGVGVGPVAVLSTTSLNFGNQPVGTTSVPRLVNLSNTGNAPMTIASITMSGDFGQTNNCPSTLAARSYCTMTVTFMAAATGPRIGAITVTDNAAGSPHVVNLIGTGVSP
ncbi:MAG: choice-of-anchor D domain-containing protein, partial [Terriglobia bacterium]